MGINSLFLNGVKNYLAKDYYFLHISAFYFMVIFYRIQANGIMEHNFSIFEYSNEMRNINCYISFY